MILNSFLDFDSKYFLEIGNFVIAWYAVCILLGVTLAAIMGVKESKKFGISSNLILDGVLICVPLAIVGARIYYVIFEWNEFLVVGNPLQTFLNVLGFTEEGFKLEGLSITGGIIVAIIFVIIYCRKRNMNTLAIFDQLAPGLLIGQICGRWGNFFNQEAYGGVISQSTFNWLQYIIPPFIMDKMKIGGLYRHPTFLYESLWNLAGLILILISRRKNKKQRLGDSICFYLIWYGLGRAILIEPFRTDALMLGDIRINVVIPLIFAVIGTVWMVLKHTKFKEPFYIETQEEYKAQKIDGVVCKLEGVLVSTNRLMKNAYYYTAEKYLNKQLYDDELEELIKKDYKEYFAENLDAIKYFEEYFNKNFNQITVLQNSRLFFETLFVHDYHVAVITKYSKEFADFVLKTLKITQFVSIIIDEGIADGNHIEKAIKSINKARNILVIADKKEEFIEAKKHGVKTCLFTNSEDFDEIKNTTYVINKMIDMENIIIE